jgi:UDP-2-acetamido-2-deoxy-ribo-hexuluronate aminotransferase
LKHYGSIFLQLWSKSAGNPGEFMQFIDLKRQYAAMREEIDGRIMALLEHGHYIMGPEIAELEQKLAAYCGVRHCLTVSSGTHSLEIALRALGVGPGDEVITVPFTWISTAEVIRLVGATPVFVDIDPATYIIDVSQVPASITPQTKAIIPVSLFGQMPALEDLNTIAERYNIAVIEDGAQSFGATRLGRRSCGMTTVGSTSFFPAKPLGCYGDGGALFTDDDGLADRMRAIRTHGGVARHHHTLVGTNGRFDTIQAAILLAKWPHFDAEVHRRGELGQRMADRLGDICGAPMVDAGNTHVYAQFTIRNAARDALAASLKVAGVPSAVYYPKCLHEQPVFADLGYAKGAFPESERAAREVLSLPMHPYLTDAEADIICDSVRTAILSANSMPSPMQELPHE